MTWFTKLPLLLIVALSLSAAGCGDDKKKKDPAGDGDTGDGDKAGDGDTGDGDQAGDGDTGDAGTGGDGDFMPPDDPTCASDGFFANHKFSEVQPHLKAKGACIGGEDLYEACKFNPSKLAGDAGRACIALPPGAFEECIAEGDGADIKGIHDTAKNLSDACTACYTAGVACSKDNCLSECIDPKNEKECTKCREEKGCAPTFFTCSGFPTADELK